MLVVNLVVIMTAAEVQALASSAVAATDQRGWMGKLDFSGLKFKILASIVAIVAIELLETYMNIAATDKTDVLWRILILLALVLAGAPLAWTDRLAADRS